MMFRRLLLLLAAFAVMASACSLVGGDQQGRADSHVYTRADEVGSDPFSPDVAQPVPEEVVVILEDLVTAADEAEEQVTSSEAGNASGGATDPSGAAEVAAIRKVRLEAATTVAEQNGLSVIAPPTAAGVGLYGGSGVNACDIEGLVGFLAANPDEAAAWAGVHGIDVSDIESYIRSLTPGFLIDDVDVLNHTFTDGAAVTIPTTLAAGTAVLVDNQGIPRVRCKCGNPLDTSGPQPTEWSTNAGNLRGRFGRDFTFVCIPNPEGQNIGQVWGVDAYTDDSSICGSAVHAGVITLKGGTVTIRMEPGRDSYDESARNGITSSSYPAWPGTFAFADG